jgi:hypothetical protein
MSTKTKFPNPEFNAPKRGDAFFIYNLYEIDEYQWDGCEFDYKVLAEGHLYLTEAEAKQRMEHEIARIANQIGPEWYRKLGKDVQWLSDRGEWVQSRLIIPNDIWSEIDPARYRAKPVYVVRVVDGVEYRWPITPKGETEDTKHFSVNTFTGEINECSPFVYAPNIHLTREAAEAQSKAIKAFWSTK